MVHIYEANFDDFFVVVIFDTVETVGIHNVAKMRPLIDEVSFF